MHYHDKKTPHRSPQNYVDLEGQTRTFTEIDMDKKTTISIPSDGTNPKEELKKYRNILIEKILSIPAAYCPTVWMDYTIRGEQMEKVEWNEAMLNDQGTPLDRLIQIHTLLSNAQTLANKHIF